MNLGVRGAVVFCDEDVSRQNNGGEKAQTPVLKLTHRSYSFAGAIPLLLVFCCNKLYLTCPRFVGYLL